MPIKNKILTKHSSKLAKATFPFKAPKHYCNQIEANNPNDPLLKQILPTTAELITAKGYSFDPLSEKQYCPVLGVIHKYAGRVLLQVTDKCAINCRFCFRKFNRETVIDWNAALNYITQNHTIKEVILSGGDPLTLSHKKLKKIVTAIAKISHIKILRIHSRLPIANPKSINSKLIAAMNASKLPVVLVTHCNHPRELTKEVYKTITALKKSNITVLNQSVLLKGVNDNAQTLIELSEKLFATGIMPYYLHLLDKVQGAKHFAVSISTAKKIQRELLANLPGFLVPKIVYEKSGSPHKIPINGAKS